MRYNNINKLLKNINNGNRKTQKEMFLSDKILRLL